MSVHLAGRPVSAGTYTNQMCCCDACRAAYSQGMSDAEHARLRDSGLLLCRCPVQQRDPIEPLQCSRCFRRIDRQFDFEIVPGERRTPGTVASAGSGTALPDPAEACSAAGVSGGAAAPSEPAAGA